MFDALDKSEELGPSDITVLVGIGFMNSWGSECSKIQYLDQNAESGKYVSGILDGKKVLNIC
tara:strand:- start:1057 stop:1242 length:186 start_codon:yes stop_codon:yes gene_type:complete